MSSVTTHTALSERPERSRNAKAQARHRAKRKAYIDQLEQTVSKLQIALGYSPDDIEVLPPPLVKIRELEQENARLERENEDLRRMLSEGGGGRGLPMEITRRDSLSTFQDVRVCDRDFKRRKMTGNLEVAYVSPSETPPHVGDPSRPPPLTIPQTMPHHYSYPASNHSAHSVSTSSPMFNLHGPAFQMPNTPSGSSATSSPPFSPAQMQEPLHSPVNHRQAMPNTQIMPNYTHRSNHYGSVKVEDEHYASSNNTHSHNGHYSLPPPINSYTQAADDGMEGWHAYSSARAHLHR